MVDLILSYISYPVIFSLPLEVQIPGLLLLAYIAYRGAQAIMSLRLIKAATNIFMFIAVAIILSRFGNGLAALMMGTTSQI